MRITFITILGIFSLWINYNNAIMFKFSNAVCQSYNESWVVINKCRLKAVSRNVSTFNFNGTILNPVYDVKVHFQLFKKANGFKPWLYNYEIDVCRFLKKAYNPVAILVFRLFKEFSNFNHSCPYMGTQIVDGFYLRWKQLPHSMPTGEYLLAITWLFDNREQFFTNAYFIYTEDL